MAKNLGVILNDKDIPTKDYVDGKIVTTLADGATTTAPSSDTVFHALAGKEGTIALGTASQYLRGDKTWQILNSASISDATNANTASMIVKRDGSGNFSAGTITASLSGNASTATKLQTARTISLTTDVTGSGTFDGSGNLSIVATVVDDSHNHVISNVDNLQTSLDGKTPFSTSTATTVATAGWYRIATSALNIGANSGLFKVEFNGTGVMGRCLFVASCHNGTAAGSAINQLGFTTTAGTLGLTQVRVVYHTTYTGNYAYVEVYNPTALAITYTVDLIDTTGWSLVAPSTAGSIPTGYTSESLTLNTGVVSMEDIEATRQLISKIATGTAPIVVTSTTKVPNLNADKVDDCSVNDSGTTTLDLWTASKIGVELAKTTITVGTVQPTSGWWFKVI